MRYSLLSLFVVVGGAVASNTDGRSHYDPRNGYDISAYTKDLYAKMEAYAKGGEGKVAGSSGTRRRLAALTDIKQVLVPENAAQLKMAIQSMSSAMASTTTTTSNKFSPSMYTAMSKIQNTIKDQETDLQFLQRFAALHLSAAINVPNKVMKDGMRRLEEALADIAPAAPTTPDAANLDVAEEEDGATRLMNFIVKFLQDISQRGGSDVGAQQTQDEFFLLLFSIGVVIFAFLPQFLFTPIEDIVDP